jgi:hypothetical protein
MSSPSASRRARKKGKERAVEAPEYVWNQEPARYAYVGGDVFQSLGAPEQFYRYTAAHSGTQAKLEPVSASDDNKLAKARLAPQIWWPTETARLEASSKETFRRTVIEGERDDEIPWRPLRVTSTSIRNFEEGENESFRLTPHAAAPSPTKEVDARRSFIGTVNVATGEIFLSPLVGTHRMDDSSHPDDAEKGRYVLQGEFIHLMQDTRAVHRREAERRYEAQRVRDEQSVVLRAVRELANQPFGKQRHPMEPELQQTEDRILRRRASRRPPSSEGEVQASAHNQLRALTSTDESHAMGFTLTKENIAAAMFVDTSGTLNARHFGTIGIRPQWKTAVMETLSRDLGVRVQEGGKAVPAEALRTLPPDGRRSMDQKKEPHRAETSVYSTTFVPDPSARESTYPAENDLPQKKDRIRNRRTGEEEEVLALANSDPHRLKLDTQARSGRVNRWFGADYGITWEMITDRRKAAAVQVRAGALSRKLSSGQTRRVTRVTPDGFWCGDKFFAYADRGKTWDL